MVDFCCPRQAKRKTPLTVVWVWGGICYVGGVDLGKQRSSHHIGVVQLPIAHECFWWKFKTGRVEEAHDDSGQTGGQVSVCLRKAGAQALQSLAHAGR